MAQEEGITPAALTRRRILRGTAAIAAAAGVSACSNLTGNESSGIVQVDNSTGAVGAAPTRAPGTGGARGGGGGADSGGAAGTRLARLSELPAGGGKVVTTSSGQKVLLIRSGSTVKAFDAACPHQGAAVRPPSGGTITCPLHGSQFAAADGTLKKGPAKSGLAPMAVKVVNGEVVTA